MIKELSFRNCFCYRGEHSLKLGPFAYAIVACHELDPGRSNFSGKSALFEAVDLALYGRLNKIRKTRGWITEGENEGGISLIFFDGTKISREQKRGQSVQIRLTTPDGRMFSQADAEVYIQKYLRFDEDVFLTVGYFQSKQMSRIIRADPRERLDAVRDWLNLILVEKAEERVSELAKVRVRELRHLKSKRQATLSMFESLSKISSFSEDEVVSLRDGAQSEIDQARANFEKHHEARGYQRIVKEYDDLVEVGKATAAKVTKIPEGLKEEHKRLRVTLNEKIANYKQASDNLATKKKVSLGLFDGKCPVAPIDCPAKKEINSNRASAKEAFDLAISVERTRFKELETAKKAEREASELRHDAEVLEERLESLRERARDQYEEYQEACKALKKLKKLPDEKELSNIIHEKQSVREAAIAQLAEYRQSKVQKEKFESDLKRLDKEIAFEEERVKDHLQVKAIFKATQRRIAERMLSVIGHRANTALAEAGAELKIDIRWEKEGKDPAKSCEMCGAAFPKSAKVKACEECGAERGMNVIQRLDFDLSDRSDGADDFAGISMQLAAGSYLLANRESPWSTCLIDEPFSALDQTLRKSAARQLLRLTESSIYKQIFVVSHSRDTVSIFPHVIKIMVDRKGQRSITVD